MTIYLFTIYCIMGPSFQWAELTGHHLHVDLEYVDLFISKYYVPSPCDLFHNLALHSQDLQTDI